MNLGTKLGMDAKLLASIFNTSTARCWSSDTYNPVPGVMPNGTDSTTFFFFLTNPFKFLLLVDTLADLELI